MCGIKIEPSTQEAIYVPTNHIKNVGSILLFAFKNLILTDRLKHTCIAYIYMYICRWPVISFYLPIWKLAK